MSNDWTLEPWTADGGLCLEDPKGRIIVTVLHDMCPEQTVDNDSRDEAIANLKRIAACVNACKGLSTEQLEKVSQDGERLFVLGKLVEEKPFILSEE